jgi:hypothetical protein
MNTAVGIHCAGHATPAKLSISIYLYPQKMALTSLTRGIRLVGMVCSRTKATEFYF